MIVNERRWQNNWRVVSPAGAVPMDVERSNLRRRAQQRKVRDLPAGTPVVLFGSAPGAMRRCRAFAARAGLELEREYLAFPSARAPGYLVEDAPASVRAFAGTVLAAPPRTAFSTSMQLGLSVLRTLSPWRATRWIAPGRVVVGRRT